MLAMLTDLLGTVFATGPLNLYLQTPGPFSPWQRQSILIGVSVITCPAIYLITLLRLEKLFGQRTVTSLR